MDEYIKVEEYPELSRKFCEYVYWGMPVANPYLFEWVAKGFEAFSMQTINMAATGTNRRLFGHHLAVKAFFEDLSSMDEESLLDLIQAMEHDYDYIRQAGVMPNHGRIFWLNDPGIKAMYPNRAKGKKIYLAGLNQEQKTQVAHYISKELKIPFLPRVHYPDLAEVVSGDGLKTKLTLIDDYHKTVARESKFQVVEEDSFVTDTSPLDWLMEYFHIFSGILTREELLQFTQACIEATKLGSICLLIQNRAYGDFTQTIKYNLYQYLLHDLGVFRNHWLAPSSNPIRPALGLVDGSAIEGYFNVIMPDNKLVELMSQRGLPGSFDTKKTACGIIHSLFSDAPITDTMR